MINKVILIGRLGKDPEIRHPKGGDSVANFSLATTESYKDKNTGERKQITDWHSIVLWRGLADVADKYLSKGDLIYVEGRIKTRSWEDKEGNTKYTTEIVGDKMTMLGGGSKGEPTQKQEVNEGIYPAGDDNSDDLPF